MFLGYYVLEISMLNTKYISHPNESSISVITPLFKVHDCVCSCRVCRILVRHTISSDSASWVCDSVGAC